MVRKALVYITVAALLCSLCACHRQGDYEPDTLTTSLNTTTTTAVVTTSDEGTAATGDETTATAVTTGGTTATQSGTAATNSTVHTTTTTTAGGAVSSSPVGGISAVSKPSATPPTSAAAKYSGIVPGSAEAGVAFVTLAKAPADRTVSVAADTKQFGRFMFATNDNDTLPFGIACHIGTDRITAVVPADVDLSALRPNFTFYGKEVLYNGAPLVSRVTEMDLRDDVTLTLRAKDGSTKTMTVHIEKPATKLPSMTISVSGFAAVNSTAEYKAASFSVGGGSVYGEAARVSGADCSVKGRGNTTWGYDKKGYTLRFDTKYALLGLPESRNYVLQAMYADHSLMRYRVGEYLSEAVGMEFTMNMRYVDLWLNGSYMGVYALTEKIEVEKNRVSITDYVSSSVAVNKMGYLLEFDDHLYQNATAAQRADWQAIGRGYYDPAINEVFFRTDILGESWINIRTTNAKNLTASHVDYISAVVSNAMTALKEGNWTAVSAYIDVESFVKWYLIEEYLQNTDSDMTSSVYMYIDVGGKLKLGPLWDLDNCAGNHQSTANVNSHALYDSRNGWFSYLFAFKEAKNMLKTEWAAMQPALSKVNSVIDETAAMLKDAATLNYERWPQLGRALASQPAEVAAITTYSGHVTRLKNHLAARKTALDAFYSKL